VFSTISGKFTMIRRTTRITLIALFLLTGTAWAQDAGNGNGNGNGADKPAVPTVAPEFASPRDTLVTYFTTINQLEKDNTRTDLWAKVYRTLELPKAAGDARQEVAWQLLAIFNKLGQVNPQDMAPGVEQVAEDKLESFIFFPENPSPAAQALFQPVFDEYGQPPGSITLTRTSEGEWKFSAASLDNLNAIYSWIEKAETRHGEDPVRHSVSLMIRQWMPDMLKGRSLFGIEAWQWFALLLIAFAAVAADFLIRIPMRMFVRGITRRYIGDPEPETVRFAVRPIGLAIGATLFWWLLAPLGIGGSALMALATAVTLIIVVGATWAAWALINLLCSAWMKKAEKTETTVDDMIIPLVRKTVKVFIIVFGVIYLADSLDMLRYFAPLLAGFGVAGLAISFAAQDIVKNLFGGVTIFLDRPFKVGERINFKGYDGIIEEIGFRSTRLRTFPGHLITIPNGSITNEPVENIARRPSIRRIMNIGITYDTPHDKIGQAVQIVKDILEEDGIRDPIHRYIGRDLMAPRVYFTEFGASALNIFVIYWFIPPAYWDYMAHSEKVNLRIFDEFEKAGIEFAFPTQTLYLAGDEKRKLAINMLNDSSSTEMGG